MKHVKTFEQLNESVNQDLEKMGYDKADIQELEKGFSKLKELKEPVEMLVKVSFEMPKFTVPFRVKSMEDFEKQLNDFMADGFRDRLDDRIDQVTLRGSEYVIPGHPEM